MRMLVTRIEHTNISGMSKTNKPYHIDNTMIAVSVPFDTPEGFGSKEMVYQYGTSNNFNELKNLRASLPIECEIELSASLNSYGNVETGISSIKPVTPVTPVKAASNG